MSLVLTCAAVESSTLKVLVDESKLDPNAAQFPPFEVVGGRHAPDVRNGDRRFFQYVYDVRLIDDSLFGKMATLPAIPLSYRLETGTDHGSSNEGIEHTYLTPAQSVRVLSLVGDDTTDIRDAEAVTFFDLAAAAVHASGLVTAGGVLLSLGALFVVVAVARVVTQARASRAPGERHLQHRVVLRGVRRELSAVRQERDESGWSPALAERVLASLRIAGRFLLDQKVTYRPEEPDAPRAAGALALAGGGGQPILVWGTITTESVALALRPGTRGAPASLARRQQLEQLQEQLAGLTQVHYGRDGHLRQETLDSALSLAEELVGTLRHEQGWLARASTGLTNLGRARRRS